MKKLFFNFFTILILFASLMPIPMNTVHAAGSMGASYCQCVVYVKNTYGLTGSAGNAADMGKFLAARGFRQINPKVEAPKEGDVIIMKWRFGHGITSAGHVAILKTVQVDSKGNLVLKMRGANQKLGSGRTPYWTENNCTNVNFWGGLTYYKNWDTSYAEFWRKK